MGTWFTPEEFCKQFAENQLLIEAIVDVGSDPVCFKDFVIRVASRQLYAAECRENERRSRLPELWYPLIDKKSNLVFEVCEGGHGFLRQQLLQIYEERGDRWLGQLEDDYIRFGYGYFCSSVSTHGMTVGKVLFDKEQLDADDEAILLDRKLKILK